MKKVKYVLSLTILVLTVNFLIFTIPPVYAQEDGPTLIQEMVLMRDEETHLYTRIYLPDPSIFPPPYPVILTRTPYGIGKPTYPPPDPADWPSEAIFTVLQGYAYVAQDTRGRSSSEGVDRLFYEEGPDGYDTIEWIASQDWCNGKIGMSGGSASGITTYLAAGENPPHLVTALSYVASANLYNDLTFDGGAYRADSMIWSFGQTVEGLSLSHLYSVAPQSEWGNLLTDVGMSLFDMYTHTSLIPGSRAVDSITWMNLPLIGGNPSYSVLQPFGDEILSHPSQDDFRDKLNVLDSIDIPMLHVGGWFDFFSSCTLDAFVTLQNKGNQKIFIAPGTHMNLGNLPYDPYYAWFDYWLKDEDTGIMDEPPVSYYCFGAEEYRWADQWPLEDIDYTNYYLHGGGILNNYPCTDSEPFKSYVYNPSDPVLTWGGRNLGLPAGSLDQRPVEQGRDDILIYTSDILAEDLEISGPVKAILSVSSNCTDTDFTAKLIDVDSDGNAMLVLDNILRARYRESMRDPVLMTPGHIYEITINLGDISYIFEAGHKIQIDISSSNFPKYDRNLNSGGDLYTETEEDIQIALNTIHHGHHFKSYVVLPIIPPKTKVYEGTLRIKRANLNYKGPAEFHTYENAVYFHFEDQWIKWEIKYHWKHWNVEFYRCEGEFGKLTVIIVHTKHGSHVTAVGCRILFKAKFYG